jgi:hypothetical protein
VAGFFRPTGAAPSVDLAFMRRLSTRFLQNMRAGIELQQATKSAALAHLDSRLALVDQVLAERAAQGE